MSDTALVPVDYTQLPSTQIGSDDGFTDLAKGGDFLARLQLCSKDKYVLGGQIPPGSWGIPESADKITNLGKSVDVVPFARRPKAVDLSDKAAIINSYDMESAEFKRIRIKAGTKDSGCMFGPSFLVFERSSGRFLEWFCGSKTNRIAAKSMYPYLTLSEEDIAARRLENVEAHGPLPFTMNIELLTKGDFKWHAPVVVPCSTPFDEISVKQIIFEMERFLNPPVSDVEKVPENEAGSARAR